VLKLYSYWRSSASYRVRIALHLKGIAFEYMPVSLIQDGGQQHAADYRALNPQRRVPLLVDGVFRLNQSLAILDYLESKHPQPSLVPEDAQLRARMWAFCHTIAADIQPLQNLGPLKYLTREFGASDEQKNVWVRHWIERGLAALEEERRSEPDAACVFGDAPTLADCCLVPQIYNAGRFNCDTARFPRLYAIAQRLCGRPEFIAAHPDKQPDAAPA
jgi:maleylacetoacetate isomerase